MHPTSTSLRLISIALLLSVSLVARAGETRDVVFLMTSDPHFGSEDAKAKPPVTAEQGARSLATSLARLLSTIGRPWPAAVQAGATGVISRPAGLVVAGDLTDHNAWPLMATVLTPDGLPMPSDAAAPRIPLFFSIGNHDGGIDGAAGRAIIAINRKRMDKKPLAAIDPTGLHCAWSWQGVHIVNVNLCPADAMDAETPFQYGKPPPRGWNDPMGAMTFLEGYLKRTVGDSGAPVVIVQHYGYCGGFNFDWNWWTAKQRRRFHDAIAPYNVIALLHGHTHLPARYRWPDPAADAAEVKRLFGDQPPRPLRSYDVFSAGNMHAGHGYAFRITRDRLVAAHFDGRDWSRNPALHAVITITGGR